MERAFIFDNINTFSDWRLILNAKSVTPPKPNTNYVKLDGMSGTLDLSESLTGEVTYEDRTVSATFLATEGSYITRVNLFDNIIKKLHGKKVKIIEPDDPYHYLYGRITVKSIDNNRVYGKITLEATCEPWRYSIDEIIRTVELSAKKVKVIIVNNGVKTIIPKILIKGSPATIIVNGQEIVSYPSNTYISSEVYLRQGEYILTISGDGSISFKYEEASL